MAYARLLLQLSMAKTTPKLAVRVFIFLGVLLYAVVPLLGKGFIPTHDGEYHIIRFWQFARMLEAGYAFPRWAPDVNSGYGLPLFIFHYPFPNYAGAFFHAFGVSFVDSFKLALATGYIVSCLACFAWLKKIFPLFAASVGAIIFSVVPYWFVEIYVRGSIGEVWAIAWLFAALGAIERKNVLLTSLSVAFLILSHNILAMLFVPTIVLYLILRNRSLLWCVIAGIFLSAYFWLPALLERGFMTGLNSVNYKDHFPLLAQLLVPSWGTGFSVRELTSDEMSYQIGIVPLFIFLLALLRFPELKLAQFRESRRLAWLFSILGIIALFLMLEASSFVWKFVPVLPFLQYPWRLLVFVLPAAAFFAARVASFVPRWAAIVLCVAAFGFSLPYMRPVVYAPRTDTHYLTRPEFTDGTSSMGNAFSTIWTPWKSERSDRLVDIREGEGSVAVEAQKPLHTNMTIAAQTPLKVRINRLYFPGWAVYDNGKPLAVDYETDGLMNIVLAPGTHSVDVRFEETPVRRAADMISLIGLLWLSLQAIIRSIYAHRHKHFPHVRRAQPAGHRPLHKRAHKRPHNV